MASLLRSASAARQSATNLSMSNISLSSWSRIKEKAALVRAAKSSYRTVLVVEAARCLGFGAKIVSGYLYHPDQNNVGSANTSTTLSMPTTSAVV
jgi:hypothetical protein